MYTSGSRYGKGFVMAEVFMISDLHLGHENILKFRTKDGNRLRPFLSLHDMHGVIMQNWAETVTDRDKIYVLGDVAFNRNALRLIQALPGKKRLVRGNHDMMQDKWYHDVGFMQIHGVKRIDRVWLTHVPMHPGSLNFRAVGNIHGHLHANLVMHGKFDKDGNWVIGNTRDMRYFNASVEQINYIPISIDTIRARMKWDETC